MNPNIIVKIPDTCYISPDPKRNYPFTFFFHVTYGYIPSGKKQPCSVFDKEADALKYPRITISGFEQLLSKERIGTFVDSLTKTGDDWNIKCAASGSDIVLEYVGDDLETGFYFSASTEKFISNAEENKLFTLTVTVKDFPNIESHSYIITTKGCYTPWAKSITFNKEKAVLNSSVEVTYEYDGDRVDKTLSQNGVLVDTARSPYTAVIDRPSLFGLEVFNGEGITDTVQAYIDVEPPQIISFSCDQKYFAEGESVQLNYKVKSVSQKYLEHLQTKDQFFEDHAIVFPQVVPGSQIVEYTLRADGYKNKNPYSVTKKITLTRTYWKKEGAAGGCFSQEIYGNLNYNSRIFLHDNKLYCYNHPKLYQSQDGKTWSEYGINNVCGDLFICLASDYNTGLLYAMGKEGTDGKKLYMTQYDFKTSLWTYRSACQTCSSDAGGFAFWGDRRSYLQVMSGGLMIVEEDGYGKWNAGSMVILAENQKTVLGGDYCFFKNSYYAAMLCNDGKVYVYNCDASMQEVEFIANAGKNDQFVNLISTKNALFFLTDSIMINVKRQELADDFLPTVGDQPKRPWLGTDGQDMLIGIYPDKNLWKFHM